MLMVLGLIFLRQAIPADAFFFTPLMCEFHLRSLSTVTPRYLIESVSS